MATDVVTPTDTGKRPVNTGKAVRMVAWYLLLTGLSILVLFPIYLTIIRALSQPVQYVQAGNPLHPVNPQWGIFGKAWSYNGGLGGPMARSLTVTVIITGAQLLTSVFSAYAFAFLDFPFKKTLFAFFMATLLLPIEITLLANLQLINDHNLTNSYAGLTLPFLASALGMFLIRQGFLGIPGELRDAASLDGYGHLRFLFRVAIPLARPVVGSFVLISFLGAWNQYLWPRAVIDKDGFSTLQIALRSLTAALPQEANIGPAGALLAALPILVLLIVFQRQIIRGLTAGAVKG